MTAVLNALRVSSKSVSVQVKVLRSLAATVPVEVSVSFNSGAESERRTQTYTSARGATLVYHASEGDGTPRPMRLDIALRELVANGKAFSFSRTLTVTPLYDARVSALRFHAFTQCDTIGKGDYELKMIAPDGRRTTVKFKLGFNETRVVPEFRWSRREVGTQAKLLEPSLIFYENDLGADYHSPSGPSSLPLLPGHDKRYSFILNENDLGPPGSPPGSTDCKAHIRYTLTRRLLTFEAL